MLAIVRRSIAALTTRLRTRDDERTAFGDAYSDHGLLFCWPDGRPIHPDTITEQFNRLAIQAGVPPIRLHDVRHTYATMALRAGVNPKIVSERLGHASVAFTLDTPEDVPELHHDAAEAVSNLFLDASADHDIIADLTDGTNESGRSQPLGGYERVGYRSGYRRGTPKHLRNAEGP